MRLGDSVSNPWRRKRAARRGRHRGIRPQVGKLSHVAIHAIKELFIRSNSRAPRPAHIPMRESLCVNKCYAIVMPHIPSLRTVINRIDVGGRVSCRRVCQDATPTTARRKRDGIPTASADAHNYIATHRDTSTAPANVDRCSQAHRGTHNHVYQITESPKAVAWNVDAVDAR